MDSGACGMAPASSELAVEMAEVYALGVLRDVPVTMICKGGSEKLCGPSENPGGAELSAASESKYRNLALIRHSIAIPWEFESGLLGIGSD